MFIILNNSYFKSNHVMFIMLNNSYFKSNLYDCKIYMEKLRVRNVFNLI